MRICDVFKLGIVKDDTKVYIRNAISTPGLWLAKGNWYEDHILDYASENYPVESFTWKNRNKIYINIFLT